MMKTVTIEFGSADYYRRHEVAKSYARWHLGDGLWASRIINAFLNPEEAAEDLAEEMAEGD